MECIERGKEAYINRDYNAALNEYEHAVRELPYEQRYVAYSNRGASLLNIGRVKDAIKCFRKALDQNPQHLEALHNLGVAYAAQKQYEKALECFDRTIAGDPDLYAAYCGKSEVLSALQRYDQAIQVSRDATRLDGNEPTAYADMGFAYLKLGRFEDSIKAYDRAASLQDRSNETARLHALALSELAVLCEKKRDYHKAIQFNSKSIQRYETPMALHNLGVLYVGEGQPVKAKSSFSKALKLDPRYFPTNAALGVLSAQEGNLASAMRFLSQAHEIYPEHAENLFNLGLVHMKDGSNTKAAKCFKSLLKLEPTRETAAIFTDAKLALQSLRDPIAGTREIAVRSGSTRRTSTGGSVGQSSRNTKRSASVYNSKDISREPSRGKSRSKSRSRRHDEKPSSKPSSKRVSSSHHTKSHKSKRKKFFTLEQLQSNPPPRGVDPSQKEMYLGDDDFYDLFGCDKDEFMQWPPWKQTLEKRKQSLF
mmetsp:Transcript_41194/g.66327  ORF Transcript_41194/g.66327 Transcript_41194/m.66327 type:complete len:480 (+) Transcript_41194:122-1561(+)